MNNHDGRPWHFCSRRYHFGGNDCVVAHMQSYIEGPFLCAHVPHSPCQRQILCAIDVGAFFLALL